MTDADEHILFLGAYNEVLRRLWQEGVATSLIRTTGALRDHPSLGDHRWVLDMADDPYGVVETVVAAQSTAAFTAVVSTDDANMYLAAAIRDRLGIGGGSPGEVVHQVHDKRRYRELLAARGLPVPQHREVRSVAELEAFGSEVGWPLVVKPVSGSGSEGVTLGVDAEAAADAFGWAAQVTPDSPTGRVLAEEQVDGDLLIVDTLSFRGRHHVLMVGFELVAQNRPIIMCTGMPAPLSAATWNQVADLVLASLDLLGVTDGPVHSEVLLTSAGPVLLESQLRLGGELPELTAGSIGLDTYQLWADVLLGRDPAEHTDLVGSRPELGTPTLVLYPGPNHYGQLIDVRGLDRAAEIGGVTKVELNHSARSQTQPVSDIADRSMAVFVQASTVSRALRTGLRAVRSTRLRLAPRTVLPPSGDPRGRTRPG